VSGRLAATVGLAPMVRRTFNVPSVVPSPHPEPDRLTTGVLSGRYFTSSAERTFRVPARSLMTIRERVLEAMLAVVDADDLDEEAYRRAWERFRGAARDWLDATHGTRARRAVTVDRARGLRLERVTLRLPAAVRERVMDDIPGARAALAAWSMFYPVSPVSPAESLDFSASLARVSVPVTRVGPDREFPSDIALLSPVDTGDTGYAGISPGEPGSGRGAKTADGRSGGCSPCDSHSLIVRYRGGWRRPARSRPQSLRVARWARRASPIDGTDCRGRTCYRFRPASAGPAPHLRGAGILGPER
jgi:hypothetical protein